MPDLRALPGMVVWFGFSALSATGLHALLSKLFGAYADQRVIQALADKAPVGEIVARYDYSAPDALGGAAEEAGSDAPGAARPDAIWVDYLADTGDGFDSTFAIASLVAAPRLEIEGVGALPAGKLLILGGDQVYPFASLEQYDARLLTPFRLADTETTRPGRKLFVIPGNHDWYDGLSAFDQLFCRARYGDSDQLTLGPWRCEQHRSYFAIRLPHDWWIWGLDTQLTHSFDMGQIQYFRAITAHMADCGKAKIILCMPEPPWYDAAEPGREQSLAQSLDRILPPSLGRDRICAIIAGDWHHYSRYVGVRNGLNLITAGGGGAFLAPTHHLKETLTVSWNGETDAYTCRIGSGQEEAASGMRAGNRLAGDCLAGDLAIFPPRPVSRSLSWRLLAFPWFNAGYALTLGVIYWLTSWMLTASQVDATWFEKLARAPDKAEHNVRTVLAYADSLSVTQWLLLVVDAASHNFLLFLFALAAASALYALAEARSPRGRVALALGHGAAHAVALGLLTVLFVTVNAWIDAEIYSGLRSYPTSLKFSYNLIRNTALFAAEMIVIGGLVAGLIWGVYLFVCCRFLNLHLSEAFSALRIADYKNFIRMRIEPDRLTLYPVGLTHIPSRSGWRRRTERERRQGVRAAFVPRTPLEPKLIEEPVVIRPSRSPR